MHKLIIFSTIFFSTFFFSQTKRNDKPILVEDCSAQNLKNFLGKRITLIGQTGDAKLGALLHINKCGIIFIADFDSWPKGYFYWDKNGKEKFKTVKITGVLIERNDLPIQEYPDSDSTSFLVKQAIQVPKGTDLKKASHRFLLKNVSWKVLKN